MHFSIVKLVWGGFDRVLAGSLDTPKVLVWLVLVAIVLFNSRMRVINMSYMYTGPGRDNLDELFSTSPLRAPLSVDRSPRSSSHFLDGFGHSHAPHVSAADADPFDIFQSPLKKEPNPMQYQSDDLLGGFEGSLGEEL